MRAVVIGVGINLLPHALATAASIDAALALDEALRRPAASRLVLANRANGSEQVMRTVHKRALSNFADISTVISKAELEASAGEYKKIAGVDRAHLSNRPYPSPKR
jgi:biotin-(acetyl-CoA carboxylase) ligase